MKVLDRPIVLKANHKVNDFTIKILIASFIAQIMVVTNHHFGPISYDFAQMGHSWDNMPVTSYIVKYFYHMSIGFGTVVFYIIAGYLFFHGFEEAGAWKRKFKSRLKSLGVPYLIWNFVASPWFTAILIPIFSFFMPWLGSARDVSIYEVYIGNAPGFYPINSPLWFVRELMLMVILSPIIWRILQSRFGLGWLAGMFVLWVICAAYFWGGAENLTQAIFAFSLGGYWQCSNRSPFSFSSTSAIIASVIAISLIALEIYFDFALNVATGLKCLAGCVIVFWLADYISRTRYAYIFAWLGEASFFIYLTHFIGRKQVAMFMINLVNPQNEFTTMSTIFGIWFFIICYTVGVWALLRRFAPRLLNFLLGGRMKKHFSWSSARKRD